MQVQALIGRAADEATHAKAQKAGAEFEAVLLNMVWSEVERSFAELPGAKPQGQTEAYSGFAMQALTSTLARTGGIGLGKFVSDAIIKTAMKHVGTPVRQVTQEF